MSQNIKLNKGFDINLVGKAEKKIGELPMSETFALKPADFVGMARPKLLVKEGENVKAGSPIMVDKLAEDVFYCSPVSGEIAEIVRGAKRKVLEIRILADKEVSFESFEKHADVSSLSKEDAIAQMMKGGVWPQIIQRPFGIVANPADTPKNIFVSTFDTHPLAPDMNFLLEGEEKYFEAGIEVLSKLTGGTVHVNHNAETNESFKTSHAQNNTFSGAHPAGNVGVQIHHLSPIHKGEKSWTVHPYGVTQIGKLFLEGKYDASKVIALTGSEVTAPQYYKTYSGCSINKLIDGTIAEGYVRYVSGNVLTGHQLNSTGYLGHYHNQITVIPEGDDYEVFGWILPTFKKLSFHKAFGLMSYLGGKNKEYVVDTNLKGGHRTFVQTGEFEKVVPMDILPTHLIKAILAEDFDDMEGLGIYEVIEEDLALCEFIDVSKNEIQAILRDGLDLVKNS
jgi:Na+-transporting NADH:ubiquinone oxidoreductase subunit A